MLLKLKLLLLALVLLPAVAIAGGPAGKNYCHDPATWPEWEEMLHKYPLDEGVLGLYGLRIGLCLLVERGALSTELATTIFERQREQEITRKKQEEPSTELRL